MKFGDKIKSRLYNIHRSRHTNVCGTRALIKIIVL